MLVLSPRWLWCAQTGLREGAHLIIEGDRIRAVVNERPSLDAERIELADGLLTPGLINLHNHAFSAPLVFRTDKRMKHQSWFERHSSSRGDRAIKEWFKNWRSVMRS